MNQTTRITYNVWSPIIYSLKILNGSYGFISCGYYLFAKFKGRKVKLDLCILVN